MYRGIANRKNYQQLLPKNHIELRSHFLMPLLLTVIDLQMCEYEKEHTFGVNLMILII